MILTIKQFIKLWVLCLLLIPCLAWSDSGLLAIGQIDNIGSNYIIITDTKFETLSIVKVYLPNKKIGKMKDLKKGDFVRLTLLKINKKKLVETIHVLDDI